MAWAWLGGCGKRYAATSMHVCPKEETALKCVLTQADQRQIEAAFTGLAEGHRPVDPPHAAANVRWSDVPLAAVYAVYDVEMAIVREAEVEGSFEFALKTVEGYPAVLRVHQTAGPDVYFAEAHIGMFDTRRERAVELLKAFDKQMRAFGRKRKIE